MSFPIDFCPVVAACLGSCWAGWTELNRRGNARNLVLILTRILAGAPEGQADLAAAAPHHQLSEEVHQGGAHGTGWAIVTSPAN